MDPAAEATPTVPEKAKRGRPEKAGKKRPPVLAGCEKKGGLKPGQDAIVDLLMEDPTLSQRDMAARLRVSLSTVQRYMAKRKAGETIVQQQLPPEPVSKREELREIIGAAFRENEEQTSPEVVQKIYDERKIEVSRYTVWRVLVKDLGLRFKNSKTVPALANPEARLEFVKRFGEIMELSNPIVIWTDETQAGCFDYRRGGFCRKGQEPTPRRKERWSPKVHVWGALWEGGAYVAKLPKGEGKSGGITKAQYILFIEQHLKPILAKVKKDAGNRPIYWMQDGASVHGKKETMALCEANGIHFVEGWPAHSPDLNPIENFWAILKRAIGKEVQLFKNTDDNRKLIVAKVAGYIKRVNPRMCARLCAVGKRLAKVRENEGRV